MADARIRAILSAVLLVVGSTASGFLRPVGQGAPGSPPTDSPSKPQVATATDGDGVAVDDFYDPDNPDRSRLQNAGEAARRLPRDRDGKIDWMAALRSGAIAPRGQLASGQNPPPHDLDIIMKRTRQMPFVRFPHRSHTEWLACGNCHPAIFEARAGSTTIRMEDIFRGHYCGTCHDRVAFVTHRACDRCHSVPNDGRGG